ncbi:MAG: DUF4231 domain-containing protein [Bryobacterales bacterium]|nr:DUF4231 domain-containing protein [Bryobacterales bacterium]MBV9400778.1 DUF4231 domain-containing protein [Bryobacterales bacterium]
MANVGVQTAVSDDARKEVLVRYEAQIAYYWKTSMSNKRNYKVSRALVIIFGAVVTLFSSVSSVIKVQGGSMIALAVITPVCAALLAIIGGMSQAFQWGAAWSDSVITATRLEKERDRLKVTPADQIDPVKEMAMLDDMVLAETEGFFQRILGSGGPAKGDRKPGDS